MQPYVYTFLLTHAMVLIALRWFYLPALWWHVGIVLSVTVTTLLLTQYVRTYILIILFAALSAYGSVSITLHTPSANTIDFYASKRFIQLEGVIAAEPDRRPMQTKYTIDVTKIINASGASITPTTGKILVTDRRQWPQFSYGDSVHVAGILEKPGLINETFYYDRYLSRYGIYSVMYSGSLTKIPTDSMSILTKTWRLLFTIKELFERQINTIQPEPHASFMAGLLTGSRKGIPDSVLENFTTTGLTHIIAISGYNITLIIVIIANALFWLPKRFRLWPSIICIALFTIFVGASAAVVRAAIMGILGLIALHTHNTNTARITVLWTFYIMTSLNPKYAWYDVGFQLSFLAVIGLLEISPLLERYTTHIPNTLGLRESIQMTLSAQITAVPFIMVVFGRVSLIAPVANVLIAPFIPLAMLFGFLGTLVSYGNFFAGQLLHYLAWGSLEYIVQVAQLLSKVPYAAINTHNVHWAIIGLYYVCICAFCIWYNTTISCLSKKPCPQKQ